MSLKNKTKLKSILFFAFLGLTFFSFGQGLITNGDFESLSGKVKKLGELSSATGWSSPTASRPDLFVTGKSAEVGVPQNMYGNENPKSGGNYAGVVGFSFGDKLPRSYMMTKLNSSMKKGVKYCVQYSISLAEGSKYACNNMGAVFTKREYGIDAKSSLIEKPSMVSEKTYSSSFGWDKVCGIYVADGNEKYMVIGNFESNEKVKSLKNKVQKGTTAVPIVAAYYYIDDVTVVEMKDGVRCDCATVDPTEIFSTLIYQKQVSVNDKMTTQQKIEAHEVYFAFGSKDLTPLGQDVLKSLTALLVANPATKIEIQGHSDVKEDEAGAVNEKYTDMANKRIASVLENLKAAGIAQDRILPSAKGSSVKNSDIIEGDDEELIQAKSRRITVRVK